MVFSINKHPYYLYSKPDTGLLNLFYYNHPKVTIIALVFQIGKLKPGKLSDRSKATHLKEFPTESGNLEGTWRT